MPDSMLFLVLFALAGALTGLLMALFGIGGGAFVVPVIDTLFHHVPGLSPVPMRIAVICSLVAIGMGSTWRAIELLRFGAVRLRAIGLLAAGSVLPGLLGVTLLTRLSGDVLRQLFALLLCVIGLWTALGRPAPVIEPAAGARSTMRVGTAAVMAMGGAAGLASAMFGLGGATLLMPLLTMRAGMTVFDAANLSTVFVAFATWQSLLMLGLSGALAPSALAAAGVGSVHAGLLAALTVALVGSQWFFSRRLRRMDDRLRRRLLAAYLLAAAAWMFR